MAGSGRQDQKRATEGRADGDDRTIQQVMTSEPVSLPSTAPLTQAAEAMRQNEIGDVVVLDETTGKLCGIVTDRDIVVRAVADGKDPKQVTLGAITSSELHCVSPDDRVGDVVRLMREKAIRRVPVVQDDDLVGIVSIGDLAVQQDPESALADISAAPAND